MSIGALLALSLASSTANIDVEELLARIEALERRNRELQVRLDKLESAESPPQPVRLDNQDGAHPKPTISMDVFPGSDAWDVGYIGTQIGLRRAGNFEKYISYYYDYSATHKDSSFMGAQIGKRWQHGNLVLGAELSATFPLNGGLAERYEVLPPYTTEDQIAVYSRRYSVALKGEIGWAFDETLLYTSAGIESTQVRIEAYPYRTDSLNNISSPFWGLGIAHRFNDYTLELEGRRGYPNVSLSDNDTSVLLKINYLIP